VLLMRRWFLSYHSPDRALAERLKAALERKDTDARVFFAPSSLRAGGFWSRALADEIAQADAFILLVGKKGVGDWQVLEYDEALDKRVQFPDFPVILVLLEGQTAPGLAFLRRLHWLITPDPSSEKDVGRLLDAASGSGTTSGEMWRYTSPYRGLAAMEEKDSDYFFGRARETVDVLTALATATDRLPVLLGNSGVGKSSLAQAGALAALKRQAWPERVDTAPEWPHAFQESRRWCFLTLKPGTEPLKGLVESFFDTWQLGATDPERVNLPPCVRARSRRDGARCVPSFRRSNGGWSASLPMTQIAFSSRQHPRAGRPMLRWRMRRSSGDGASCAIGLLRSASFSPGKRGSKPRAELGGMRRTARRTTRCSWASLWHRRKAGSQSARRTFRKPTVSSSR
jgi:hypothetical protein